MSKTVSIKLSDIITPIVFLAFFQFAATALSQFIYFKDNFIILQTISAAIGINRVTYDITSKPPGTIEWE